MKRNAGASAGIVALLALFVHSQMQQPAENSAIRQTQSQPSTKVPAAQQTIKEEFMEGPWLTTQAFFHVGSSSRRPRGPGEFRAPDQLTAEEFRELSEKLTSPEELPAALVGKLAYLLGLPSSGFGRTESSFDPPQMFSMVATVANPLHSRMSLALDGELEAIERSVQQNNRWEFATQWLPWLDHFDASEPNINTRRRQRALQREQEEMPGVLVFRAGPADGKFPNRVLFVFLVPETVVSGVNGPAFFAAMHFASVLSSPGNDIGLLAPGFSGSFSSLAHLVTDWRQRRHNTPNNRWEAGHDLSKTVYSGSVSNLAYARVFVKQTGLDFHGGILDSFDYQRAACEVLKKYNSAESVAALKEDEGGLQQAIGRERPDAPEKSAAPCISEMYFFPRDISHLRNAYEEGTGGARDPYADQSSNVSFSIKDPNGGEDSIPTFSDAQTPLVQNAVLDSITEDLNRKHIHIVFISATNTLDSLFLLRVVRHGCPGTRVLLEGPNILFVAAASREDLTGTLFLSPYPMFFEGDAWLGFDRRAAHIMFPEASLQGLFNVTQFLLEDMHAVPQKTAIGLRGYARLDSAWLTYPGMWVLVLNRFGFLPVDLFKGIWSSMDRNQQDQSWFKLSPGEKEVFAAELPPRGWLLTALMVSVFIVLVCFLLIRANVTRGVGRPLWLVLSDGYQSRLQVLLTGCLALSALEWILVFPAMTFFRGPQATGFRVRLLEGLSVLGFLGPLLTLAYLVLMRRRSLSTAIRKAGGWRIGLGIVYCALPIAFFIAAVICWAGLCSDTDSGRFFQLRAVELYSGSSPALPWVLACGIFFCISVFHFKRYAVAGQGRARLSVTNTSAVTEYQVRLQEAYQSIERRIAAPLALSIGAWTARFLVCALFVGLSFIILASNFKGFELPAYNWLLGGAIAAILFCLATHWYDLLKIWQCVEKLLNLIQILPLQAAVERIAREWPRQPIWAFLRSVSKESIERQMLYALHSRMVLLKKLEQNPPSPPQPAAMAAVAGAASEGRSAGSGADPGRSANAETTAAQDPPPNAADAKADFETLRDLILGKREEKKEGQQDGSSDKWPAKLLLAVKPTVCRISGKVESDAFRKLREMEQLNKTSADIAAEIHRRDLRRVWRESLNYEERMIEDPSDPDGLHQKYVRSCSDFVALQFCRFIAYAIAQVKRIGSSLSVNFVLVILLFNSYSPQGPRFIGGFLIILFVVIGLVVWRVFAHMERNPILSGIARTKPGELNSEFWVQLIALGGLPFLGILAHVFPSVSQFLFQWVAPSVQEMH